MRWAILNNRFVFEARENSRPIAIELFYSRTRKSHVTNSGDFTLCITSTTTLHVSTPLVKAHVAPPDVLKTPKC